MWHWCCFFDVEKLNISYRSRMLANNNLSVSKEEEPGFPNRKNGQKN